jgi:ornithine carbamoyltransferase
MTVNNFLNLNEIAPKNLEAILEDANKVKKATLGDIVLNEHYSSCLNNTITGLLFEKLSTRTRLSFEAAVLKLGGQVSNIRKDEIHLGQGETLQDTSAMFSLFLDVLVLRLYEEKKLYEFARNSKIPIINGLTNESHPCQVLADIFTFQEFRGSITGKKVVWLGVANNVFQSFLHAAAALKFQIVFSGPSKFQPSEKMLEFLQNHNSEILTIESNPVVAVENADLVVTDKWVSMHDNNLPKSDLDDLASYRVTKELLGFARTDVLFMHCLPADKGQEVSQDIFEDKRCVTLREAENRMHVQKSILRWCLGLY